MFIGSYRGCLETPKNNKRGNKITTYSVYKMDRITTKASPVGKKYNNWTDAMNKSAEMNKSNTDKGVYYFPDEN